MASKKRVNATSQMKSVKGYASGASKPSSKGRKPASKKEKLFGQELGKTGRAAERGGPVNKVQEVHRRHSEQVMYSNKMKNEPLKKKLTSLAEAGIAGMAAAPIGIRTPQIVTKAINKTASSIGRSMGDEAFDRSLTKIEGRTPNYGGKIKGMRGTVVTPGGVSSGRSSYRVTPTRSDAQVLGDVKRQITMAEREAAKISSYSSQAARRGIVGGAAVAGTAAGAAGLAAGYVAGKRKSSSTPRVKKK